jgi:hypothetical protein
MDPASWKKSPQPVFTQSKENGVYAPGHNSFFKSPDGREDFILYHANSKPGLGCGRFRSPRAQRFSWKKDGTPDFGVPVKEGVELPAPSGEENSIKSMAKHNKAQADACANGREWYHYLAQASACALVINLSNAPWQSL